MSYISKMAQTLPAPLGYQDVPRRELEKLYQGPTRASEDDLVDSIGVKRASRSYIGLQVDGGVATAQSDDVPLVISAQRPEDGIISQLEEFRTLGWGWDGENAAPPSSKAIAEARRFVRALGTYDSFLDARLIEPSLHVDGSIILEIPSGDKSSLQFRGDGKVSYATANSQTGRVDFDGYTIPKVLVNVFLD